MPNDLVWFPFPRDLGRFQVPGSWGYGRLSGAAHVFVSTPPASGRLIVNAADGPPVPRRTCEELLAGYAKSRPTEVIQDGLRLHRTESQTEIGEDVYLQYEWTVVMAIPPNRLRSFSFTYLVKLWEADIHGNCAAVVGVDGAVRHAEYSRKPPPPGPHAMLVNLNT